MESGWKTRSPSSVTAELDPQAMRWLSDGEKRAEEEENKRDIARNAQGYRGLGFREFAMEVKFGKTKTLKKKF